MDWGDISRTAFGPRIARTNQLPNADELFALLRSHGGNAGKYHRGRIAYTDRRGVVAGYRELCEMLGATHFLTFMPWPSATPTNLAKRVPKPEVMASNIMKWGNRIERKALGRWWYKRTENRLMFVGFLEGPDIKPHYHVVAVVPPAIRPVLKKFGSKIWKKLVRTGMLDVKRIKKGAVSYSTKDLHHFCAPENVIIYKPISKDS